MKSFNEFNDDDDYLIEDISIRSVSAVALVSRSNTISKNIKNIKVQDSDLNNKLNLLSKQLLYNSILVAQLGIMNKKR
jgi:predicted DNA-binding protein YlxM (UPF0122 family)